MDVKLNILILGMGGNVSQGIASAIKLSGISCRMIGACVSSESLGLYFCDAAYVSPYAKEKSFIPWLLQLCAEEKIDIIFSGVEEVIQVLEENRNFLKNSSILFISSPLEWLRIGNNKLLTCEWLKKNQLNYPLYAKSDDYASVNRLIEQVGFPVIAKPIIGKGSSGVLLIHSKEEMEKVSVDDYIIQENLGDDHNEYTVGCYINRSGALEGMIVLKRSLKYGTTFRAEIIKNSLIEDECRKICSSFGAIGPLNIQLRLHKGKPVCFELNVRFSGTTALRARWGFNDVHALISEYVLNVPIQLKPVDTGLAFRYFNEAYIDNQMYNELANNGKVTDCLQYNNYKEHL